MQNNQQQPQIDVNKLNGFACECGHDTFSVIYEIKIVPEFYTPSGKKEHAPIQLFKCNNCGKIQYEIAGLKKDKNATKETKTKNSDASQGEGDGIIRSLK